MTGLLIHTRQTTLSPNSNSLIRAPQSGTCFSFSVSVLFPYVHGVWQRLLSHTSSVVLPTPLCNTSFMPSLAPKHDQTRTRSNRVDGSCSLISTSFSPWFRFMEAFGHIINAVLHIDTARFSSSTCSSLLLRVRPPRLSYRNCPARASVLSCAPFLLAPNFTRQGGIHLTLLPSPRAYLTVPLFHRFSFCPLSLALIIARLTCSHRLTYATFSLVSGLPVLYAFSLSALESICFVHVTLLPPFPRARRHGRTHSLASNLANYAFSYILLAPKDKDHYSPILDLERTLYTIVERERLWSYPHIPC